VSLIIAPKLEVGTRNFVGKTSDFVDLWI